MRSEKGITVGTFDGLHRGHCAVLDFLEMECRKRNLEPEVITFDPHPLKVVAPERAPRLLEVSSERKARIEKRGPKVEVIEFDKSLQSLTVEEWIRRLKNEFNAALLVVGYDNTFGCDGRSMSFPQYVEIGEKYGVEVIEAPVVEGVSSSRVRKALNEGDVEKAAEMLDRRYSISGVVAKGRGDGHRLGFPTANLQTDPDILIPKPGVYAAEALTQDGKRCKSVVNIGKAPTISADLPVAVEAHLIGFSGDIYGERMRLDFIARLRDEERFPGLTELKAAIAADVDRALKIDTGKGHK